MCLAVPDMKPILSMYNVMLILIATESISLMHF